MIVFRRLLAGQPDNEESSGLQPHLIGGKGEFDDAGQDELQRVCEVPDPQASADRRVEPASYQKYASLDSVDENKVAKFNYAFIYAVASFFHFLSLYKDSNAKIIVIVP